mmetsp:Transcript_16508/g.29377  ORF Transcript_16508/g.29377 Transcript_16508/m.29377 type:complete len:134 (+) Transcript_16508:1146-1547(+)
MAMEAASVMLDMRGTTAPRRAPSTTVRSVTVSPVMMVLSVLGIASVLLTTSLDTGREYHASSASPCAGDFPASTFAPGVLQTLAQDMESAMMVRVLQVNVSARLGGALLIVLGSVLVSQQASSVVAMVSVMKI